MNCVAVSITTSEQQRRGSIRFDCDELERNIVVASQLIDDTLNLQTFRKITFSMERKVGCNSNEQASQVPGSHRFVRID